MKKRRIVMIWAGMAVVSVLSLAALAEPAQDAPRKRGAEPDKVAREAGEISRWLIEHPDQAERILLNLRKQRAERAAAPAPRRPDKAETAKQPGRGNARQMNRPEREETGRLPGPQREQIARRFERGAEAGKPVRRGPDRMDQPGMTPRRILPQIGQRLREGFQQRRSVEKGKVDVQIDRRQPTRPDQEIAQRLDRLEAMVKRLAAQIENLRKGETPQREGRAMRRGGEVPQREGRAMRRGGETPQREGRAFRR